MEPGAYPPSEAYPTDAPGAMEMESVTGVSAEDDSWRGATKEIDEDAIAQAGPPPPPQPAPAPKTKPENKSDGTTAAKQEGPLLIYTANYTMAVYEVTQSIDATQALAKSLGGYLVRRDDRSITIRVPAEKYRGALEAMNKLGDVLHHEETVEDVTDQYFDMKTRLDNARAMRVRLQELLAAAKDVNDALAVERELARVTETIEQMEGKLKRLRELINFSTITVTFNARGGESVTGKVDLPFSWLRELGLSRLLQLR
jgi:hypothetical protein